MAPPTHRMTAFSSAGSTTKSVGHTSTGYFVRNGALLFFSVSIESQTNWPARAASDLSEKTKACIERHVWHHGAQASTKSGSFRARASASALP